MYIIKYNHVYLTKNREKLHRAISYKIFLKVITFIFSSKLIIVKVTLSKEKFKWVLQQW